MTLPRIGPGALVAAAFVGPGTVTTATLAGAHYGYVLLWGIALSTVATVVLQEMAARLGVVGRIGLGEALRRQIPPGLPFAAAAGLVVTAIGIGNAAYEGGNLAGATLGLDAWPSAPPALRPALVAAVGALAGGLLWWGRGAALRGTLLAAVTLMSVAYVLAAVAGPTDFAAVLRGMFQPRLPSGSELTLVALIGTTVVPYNLFLHASTAREHYATAAGLPAARTDTYLSICIGGAVTLCVAAVAAPSFPPPPGGVADVTAPLTATLGDLGAYVTGFGFLAAGLSSAITAPLAASYALSELFGWPTDGADRRFRTCWIAVLGVGLATALLGAAPVPLILLAQVTNGILLPVVAGFLLWTANDRALLGEHRNRWWANALGGAVVAVTLVLSARTLYTAVSG